MSIYFFIRDSFVESPFLLLDIFLHHSNACLVLRFYASYIPFLVDSLCRFLVGNELQKDRLHSLWPVREYLMSWRISNYLPCWITTLPSWYVILLSYHNLWTFRSMYFYDRIEVIFNMTRKLFLLAKNWQNFSATSNPVFPTFTSTQILIIIIFHVL